MRKYYYVFVISLCLLATSMRAQLDSLQILPEVVLSDVKLRDFSQGTIKLTVTDSMLRANASSLTQALRQESLIYFRENGPGGVSSPSLRGTSAQQTAVVWNGININSQLNGQTDFNTIATRNYDNLTLRVGGGSIPYGSGAIGGSVHLNNEIRFGNRFENDVVLSYGSFNTPSGHYKSTYATKKFYIDAGVDYRKSDNDFEYLDTEERNENGGFENTNLNLNLGVKLAPRQLLKIYHNTFLGDRNFSGTLTAPSDDGYKDRNARTLVEWATLTNKVDSKLRFAHVFEQFEYFPNGLQDTISTLGKANRFTANYDLTYRFTDKTSLKGVVDFTSVAGDGTNIERSTRNLFSAVVLWSHKVNQKFSYGAQVRQEVTNDFDSPLLIGVGGEYTFAKANSRDSRPTGERSGKAYTLTFNASRNYRIPTFNDLYWLGAGAVGNRDLLPETSLQGEIGHKLSFKNLSLGAQTYYIRTKDLIVWQPNVQGIWSPVNVNSTEHLGAELNARYDYSVNNHKFSIGGNYGYTSAINTETGAQLIYVPKQKVTGSLGYTLRKWTAFYQFLYNDEAFTTTDNTASVAGYAVSNVGVSYTMVAQKKQRVAISLRALNIYNKNYQTVAFRPNPGRNFLIQTTYTF